MSKNVAILVLVLFVTITTYSQTSIIKGSVRNYQTTAYVPGATVKLQSINDTSFIQASISDSAGKFQFSQLPIDSFKLSITSVGFTPSVVRVKSDTAIVNLGAI